MCGLPDDVWETVLRLTAYTAPVGVCKQLDRVRARTLSLLPPPSVRTLTFLCPNALCPHTATLEVEWTRTATWNITCHAICARPMLHSVHLPALFWARERLVLPLCTGGGTFLVEGGSPDAVVRVSLVGGARWWYLPLASLFPEVVDALRGVRPDEGATAGHTPSPPPVACGAGGASAP